MTTSAKPTVWHFVTGCDSGFGSIVVKMLAERGSGVFATHLLPESQETLRNAHCNIVPLRVDITDQASVDAAVRAVTEELEKIPGAQLGGLVNNAGLMVGSGPVEWTPARNYEAMFAVNVVGAVRVTNGLLPHLRRAQGRIVNVASIAGRFALPTQAAYCASKYAMEGYSDCLRREIEPWGVTVHIIEPGVFSTTSLYTTYHQGTEKLWKALDPKVQEDYGIPFKEQCSDKIAQVLTDIGSTDITLVPKAMVHALTSARPQYRYHVGWDSKILVPLLSMIPEQWTDNLFQARKPGEKELVASAQPPNGRALALRRYRGPSLIRHVLVSALLAYLWLRLLRFGGRRLTQVLLSRLKARPL